MKILIQLILVIYITLSVIFYINNKHTQTQITPSKVLTSETDAEEETTSQSQKISLVEMGQKFAASYGKKSKALNKQQTNTLFPSCEINPDTENCLSLRSAVYDKRTNEMLLAGNETKNHFMGNLFPKHQEIPQTCGFGTLLYDRETQEWQCRCHAPKFFGGDHCDEAEKHLTTTNKCLTVAESSNLNNFDMSTFNPILEGVCVECSVPNAVPILDANEPKCEEINKEKENTPSTHGDYDANNPCFYDALSPSRHNSPVNKYIQGYGCSCDYYNGFVEVIIEGHRTSGPEIVSHACIKIGQKEPYHRTDVAYYTLTNSQKPIQVHSYKETESPFNRIFAGKEILVKQQAYHMTHKHDWLNRKLKASRREKIRRLNYPQDTWPIVDKYLRFNQYRTRHETRPVSANKLITGKGFETKHFYETTNNRWKSNAIWGHPVIYTYYDNQDGKWEGKCTLNPLAPKHREYYGLTLLTKPGETVRMDTRGYQTKESRKVVTLPPDPAREMIHPDRKGAYIGVLFVTYRTSSE